MKRLFLALELPAQVRAALAQAVGPMRRRVDGVKWVAQENLHVTLKFLGDTPEEQIAPIGQRIAGAANEVPPLALAVGALGAFPSLRKPRILWASVSGDLEPLVRLARRIDSDLEPLGFVPEDRPFSPHVTLGRMRTGQKGPSLEELASRCDSGAPMPFSVSCVTLFWSQLARTGPTYTVLERYPFGR